MRKLSHLVGVAIDDAVFLDVESLKPGDRWRIRIETAIREASVFVLFWCCVSMKSEFVAREIVVAMEDQDKVIVPVLLCQATLPSALAERQWIDLRNEVRHVCENHESGCHDKRVEPRWIRKEDIASGSAFLPAVRPINTEGFGWTMRALLFLTVAVLLWKQRHASAIEIANKIALYLLGRGEN